MRLQRVVVAGGGTGGHFFPGLAVLEALRRRRPELQALWVGTDRGIEARRLPRPGLPLERLRVVPLKGGGALGALRGLSSVPAALARAAAIVRRHRAQLVLGVGGYASGPVVLAAAGLRVPTAVLEQNARVGLTNRLLAPVVGRAFVSFEETVAAFPSGRARCLGNPVRPAFARAAEAAAADPGGLEARADTLLVLGGSQGARRLDEVVPRAVAQWAGARSARIVHQAGRERVTEVERAYARAGLRAEVVPFLEDVAGEMLRARLLVARAGATTVAELCAVGRPAVLVPYPYAADDHQRANAEALQRQGAARCLLEGDLRPETLAAQLAELWPDAEARRRMAAAARALGRPQAADDIAEALLGWVEGAGRGTAPRNGTSEPAGGRRPPGGAASARRGEESETMREATGRVRRRSDADGRRARASAALQWTEPGGGVRGQRPYVPRRGRAQPAPLATTRPRLLTEPGLLELD